MTRNSREQISRVVDALGRAVDWLLEGIGLVLPDRWREIRRRPNATIKDSERGPILEERSLFGASTFRPHDGSSTACTSVRLPPADVFRTTISLPRRAAGRIGSALRFRLAEISPIKPEDAAIAFRIKGTAMDGRVVVDMAITRAAIVQDAIDGEPARIVEVMCQVGDEPALTFRREVRPRAWSSYRLFAPWLALAASAILLFVAVSARMDRRIQSLQVRSERLIEEIKTLDREARLLTNDSQVAADLSDNPEPRALIGELDRLQKALPKEIVFEHAETSAKSLRLFGFAPSGTVIQPGNATMKSAPSLRPGFDHVEIETALKGSP